VSSHGFILRQCRSLRIQVVRCDSVSLHAVSASFIVRAFSGAIHLLCPLLTSPPLSMPVTRHFVGCCQPTAVEISRGKARHFRCTSAGFTKCIPKPQMEDFAVTCPLVPDAPRLISGFCSSPRSFGFSFLQTLPHGNALAVLLAFGSAKTWLPDFHRHSYVPCPAHTFKLRGAPLLARPARMQC
jgi:hypothetical protein